MDVIRTGFNGLALRFLLARRLRTVLTVAGVALGAALLSAILILGVTLRSAVTEQMREQFGTYDLIITAPSFVSDVLDSSTVAAVQQTKGVRYALPLLTRKVESSSSPVQFYVGTGPFPAGESGLRMLSGRPPGPGEVALPQALTQRLGVSEGENVTLPFPDGNRELRVTGVLPNTGSLSAWLDYEWLAQQLHLPGPAGLMVGLVQGFSKEKFAAQFQADFPALNLDLRRDFDKALNNLNGFGTLGKILGLAALLTGGVLVLGSFGISVQERTQELAMLRAVGAQTKQVSGLVIREAWLVGIAGAVSGVGLGVAAAWVSNESVARYLDLPAHPLSLPPVELSLVAAGAVILTFLGARPAARRAGGLPPLTAMRAVAASDEQATRSSLWLSIALLVLATIVAALCLSPALSVPAQTMLGTLAALLLLLAVLAGLSRTVPWLSDRFARLARRWFPAEGQIAQRNMQRYRNRMARTASVMVLGLTLIVALLSMLMSEVQSQEESSRQRFPTEAQITGPWGSPVGYGEDLVSAVRDFPGVDQAVPLGLEFTADLIGYDPANASPAWLDQVRRNGELPQRVWLQPVDLTALAQIYPVGTVQGELTGGIVLSRKLAADMGLQLGQQLALQRPQGETWSFRITALVDQLPFPYVMNVDSRAAQFSEASGRYRVTYLALGTDADRAAVRKSVESLIGTRYAAYSYRELGELLKEYKQRRQQGFGLVVAASLVLALLTAVGLINTVVATMNERKREMAVLRAMGASPHQMFLVITLENFLFGLSASTVGSAAALLVVVYMSLAALLNGAGVTLSWSALAFGFLTGPVLAVLAALPMVRSVVRTPLRRVLQSE